MADNHKIHDFALRYHYLYTNAHTSEREVVEKFADECFGFEFDMDCGHAFEKAYGSNAFHKTESLNEVLDQIDDVMLLGSGIFSKWRYITHWSYGESPLDEDNRTWFISAFAKLADLTFEGDDSSFVFSGKLKKIKIISNNVCFGPCPEPGDETEQHLTINDNGGVWLSRQDYSGNKIEKTQFTIDKDKAQSLIKTFEVRFSRNVEIDFVTDVGSWEMTLTNDEDKDFIFTGPLIGWSGTTVSDLSDIVRETVGRDDLFVFDGNPDRIEDITVKYHRVSKIKPKVIPEGATWEYLTWNYSEELRIDRSTSTLTHIKQMAEKCRQTNTYEVDEGISNLLDDFYPDIFDEMPEIPIDEIDNPNEQRTYEIVIHSKHGEEKHISGSYDKNGLPEEWADFIEDVYNFMAFYGIGELFEKDYYNKPKRRKSDYIFCDVVFEEGNKTYCYIADDDSYEINDMVLVPAGKDNHEAVVRIVDKNYYTAEDAPFPEDKAKHIIRRIEDDEFDKYLETGEIN